MSAYALPKLGLDAEAEFSRNQFGAPRLCFHSHQEALDYAAHSVKYFNNLFAFDKLNLSKRYEEEEIELVIEIGSRPEGDKHHLVFCAIPDVRGWDAEEARAARVGTHRVSSVSHRNDDFVFLCVADFIQGPEKIVSSWVRLEPAKKRVELWWYISAPPLDGFGHTFSASGEWEGSGFRVNLARSNRDGVTRIVEGPTEAADNLGGNVGNVQRKGFCEYDLANFVADLIGVRLGDLFVGMELPKVLNFPLEITKAFFSPRELLL